MVGVPTGIAMITVDRAGENMITVAPGANHEVSPPTSPASPARRPGEAHSGQPVREVLVISAEVPVPVIGAALAAVRRAATLRGAQPRPGPSPAQAAELVARRPRTGWW